MEIEAVYNRQVIIPQTSLLIIQHCFVVHWEDGKIDISSAMELYLLVFDFFELNKKVKVHIKI